jgi:hypothetical protein
MNQYRSIRFTRRSLAGVVENQLPDKRALAPFVEVDVGVIERLVDGELQPHGLFDLVADPVVAAVFKAIVGVELVDVVDALLVNPDRDGVAGLVGHGQPSARARLETNASPEVAA